MDWYLKVLKQYVDFNGRARRSEYWTFLLFSIVFAGGAMLLDKSVEVVVFGTGYGPLFLFFALATFVPGTAVAVRRLHDIGKSGWMLFIVLIPVVGAVWMLVLLLTNSKAGANEYGENPKGITS